MKNLPELLSLIADEARLAQINGEIDRSDNTATLFLNDDNDCLIVSYQLETETRSFDKPLITDINFIKGQLIDDNDYSVDIALTATIEKKVIGLLEDYYSERWYVGYEPDDSDYHGMTIADFL